MFKILFWRDIAVQAWQNCRQHPMRSLLAMLGIIWGTVTIIVLLALGDGFYRASQKNMRGIVDGSLMIYSDVAQLPYRGQAAGRAVTIQVEQMQQLSRAIAQAQYLSPVFTVPALANVGEQITDITVTGVNENFEKVSNNHPKEGGRFFNYLDLNNKLLVAVLSDAANKSLFNGKVKLGELVFLNSIPFVVIGVLPDDRLGAGKEKIFIPYTTLQAIWPVFAMDHLLILPEQSEDFANLKQAIKKQLHFILHLHPLDEKAITIIDFGEMLKFYRYFMVAVQAFMGFCGLMTLAVGALGIANVMYLIVTERQFEIGLKKALGATKKIILTQFLLEALWLMGVGGLIGIALAKIIISLIAMLTLPEWLSAPELSGTMMLMVFSLLLATGVLAGLWPAKKAAQLDPRDALIKI